MDVKKIIGKALVFVGAFAGAKLAQKGVDKYINKPDEEVDASDDDDICKGTKPTDEEIKKIVNFKEKEDDKTTDD